VCVRGDNEVQLQDLLHLTHLRTLHLYRHGYTEAAPAVKKALAQLPLLATLHLPGFYVPGTATLDALLTCPHLANLLVRVRRMSMSRFAAMACVLARYGRVGR
jgi:hypothetical protein